MNSKERMLAALRAEPVDMLPVAPIYLHLYLAEEIRRRALAGYREWIGDQTQIPMEPQRVADIQSQALVEAWESLGEIPDWISIRLLPPSDWLAQCILQRNGDRLWRVHAPSGEREELSAPVVETDSTTDRWARALPASEAEVEALVPVLAAEELLNNGSLAMGNRLVESRGERLFVCGTMGSPFWRCYSILGFQGLMTMPHDNPKMLHRLLQRQTEALVSLARGFAALGAHGVFIEECLTSADLISPRVYDEFVFSYDQVLLGELRKLGLPSILYVCGDVIPRLYRLVELAPTALGVEESKKGFEVNLADVAGAVGDRLVLFGNLDATQIMHWSDAEMAAQIARQVRAARRARAFIVSMGSPFPLDTPRERIAAFMRAARQVEPTRMWA